MTTLTLSGVRHRFADADTDTVHGLDLDVGDGEMVAVVGPSGSGKSTLLRIAAGLLAPTAGEVHLDGRPVTHLPPERRDLTVMFQRPHLFTHLDVAGNVAFAPRLRGAGRREARTVARRYLALVHLDGLDRRHPRQLSGGQQQRVALARALAAERGVMLLDEPFSSLDRPLRASMHELLDEVRAALEPTVLLVTHDLDEAALAERVAVLIGGRVHQVGRPGDLYRSPATLATARLVGGFAEVDGVVADGRHVSRAWGSLPLPAACAVTGPATLLLRREELELIEPDAVSTGGPTVAGVVARLRRAGPRLVATVDTTRSGGESTGALEVELEPDEVVHPGDRVVARLRRGSTPWAVPAQVSGRIESGTAPPRCTSSTSS